MRIVAGIGETLEVCLLSPRVLVSILSFPMHGCLLVRFVPLNGPFARPRESFTLDIVSLLHRFWRWECWSRSTLHRYNRQLDPRPAPSAQFKRRCHRVG